MKKIRITGIKIPSFWNKIFRLMKLTFLFLVVGLMQLSASVYSQTTKLSLEMRNAKVAEVLDAIESQSEFRFAYSPGYIDLNREVTVDIQDKTINESLQVIFAGTDVVFGVFDRHILLYPESMETSTEPVVSHATGAQQRTVSGSVTDESGQPLPGVTVVVKGTTQGTVTNADGNYSLANIPEDATLVFSFVGMKTQEVEVGNQSTINVAMEVDAIGIEEVVAIGYGTQKKINLTGSVSTTDMDQLDRKTTATQTSQLLAGEVSGITITEEWGKPGRDQSSLQIRGLGTFSGAGNNPFVLVDGVPSSIDHVNPNDIASISVLKDAASASIYGSRAANGVIIIETEKGKRGEMQVRYESYVGLQEVTELPQYLDSWTTAEAENLARVNEGLGLKYSEEEIEKFRSGDDPDEYPNKYHLRDFFNSGNGLQTKHNLTFSGGTKAVRYLFSAGYLRKNGVVAKNYNDRYDVLLNVYSELRDNLKLNVSFKGINDLIKEPAIIDGGLRNFNHLISLAQRSPTTFPGKRSDGTYGVYVGHPAAQAGLDSESFYEKDGSRLQSNVSLEWDIFSSLKLTGRAGYNLNYAREKEFGAEFDAGRGFVFEPSRINIDWSKNDYLLLEAFLNYEKTFSNHYIHLLGGFSQEESNNNNIGGFRDIFPTTKLPQLSVASSANDENWGGANTWKLRSFFGRLNYSFNNRYLLEGNLRYDGSSRFSEGNQYGLFPSFSAGWILSEEDFFEIPWIKVFKLRASWGVLGNQQIGNYPYQKTLSLGHDFYPGEKIEPGIRLATLPNYDITWESTQITDVGLDLNLFEGKLNFVVDYYYKKTTDILYNLTISKVLGMGVGKQNAGEVENRGWDFELVYKNTVGDFSYKIRPIFSAVQNKVISLANVEKDIGQGLFVGEPLQSFYGYVTDGLFIDQEDIDNYAEQNYNAEPGFPRYKDIGGPDGVPDGKITSEYDRKVIGSSFPKYSFGLGISANYKNFDLFVLTQGQGGIEKIVSGKRLALYNNGPIEEWHWEERWTEDNPDRYARYPKFISSYSQPFFQDVNDYWLRDASFLRVKDVQIGYNIPQKILKSTFIDECRIYFSGRNLYCFDSYEKGWDPEMYASEGSNIYFYPLTRLWSLGVNINF
jgi:TonB-dependent starch-binding outer membrane protein SusC